MPNFDSDNQNARREYIPVVTFNSIIRRLNIQKRYILPILVNIGFILIFAIRSNLCLFKFDPMHLAYARAYSELCFVGGYFLIQIPTAILISRFSPFKIFSLSILCSVLVGLVTPFVYRIFHENWLMFIGFLQGLTQGAAFPAAHGIWQYWTPPIERSTVISIAYSGCFFGIAFGAQISNLVCDLLPRDNVLIVYCFLGIIWFVIWTWSIYENPSLHPTITNGELEYLKQSIGNHISTNDTSNSIPWREILSTKSTWSLYVVFFCRTWTSLYLLKADFSDFDFIHDLNVQFIEYPAIVIAISLPIVGFLADLLLTKTTKSVSYIRRLYISGGLFGQILIYLPGIFIIHHIGPLFLNILFSGFIYSCIICGFFVNHVDIAPKFAHVTMAISNVMNALASFLFWTLPMPLPFEPQEDTPGYNMNSMESFFIFASVLHIIGGFTYFICGSGQIEKWSKSETEAEENHAVSFSNNSIGV